MSFRAGNAMRTIVVLFVVIAVGSFSGNAFAQATNATGSISGTVTDPSGAVVPDVKVTIKNNDTGQVINTTSSGSGAYNSGPLSPGNYSVKAEAKGFNTSQLGVAVQVGTVANGNIKMALGSESQVVEVTGESVRVNTEQPSVQGVLNTQQIENLPVNGRNFLDLAQLEPGVQIQDGGNFDPTKNGFSSVSFGGRAGRTARITLDGIDVSDETVGTTTQNISAGAINEFQLSQSTMDLSTELTSSGAVNVVTKSGKNKVFGEAFGLFRDKRAGIANFPGGQDNYFQRNHFGGSLGGPIVKDKLFWFVNAERVKQATLIPVNPTTPFSTLPSGYNSPFKDTNMMGKLDFNGPKGMKLFYRFTYNWNSDIAAYGTTYQPFANRDNTPAHGLGVDWAGGRTTHSIRYGHLKFQNHIADAVLGGGVFNPAGAVPVAIRIGGASSPYRFGPSRLAPQATFQTNDQIKYDGSFLAGSHLFRYGIAYNDIRGGGFASFYNWPEIRASSFNAAAQAFAATGPFPGGAANPLNYRASQVVMGNGQGVFTEIPAFGFPGGGQKDHRIGLYIGDSWKIRPTFTLTYGVRYSRDTGRQDSDLPPITCDQIPAKTLSQLTGPAPCSGSTLLLDQFGGKFGGRVNQPNSNFGPQIGFAWDPTGGGRTSVRGGAGIYYENAVFNNVLFDRPARLTEGFFNIVSVLCPGGQLTIPSGTITSFPFNGANYPLANLCGTQRIGQEMPIVAALENYYQQQTAAGGAAANAGFVGAALSSTSLIAPNYKTPRSYQMNLGIQHEIAPGTVLSADVIRNIGLHYLLGVDTNHVGDIRYFNKANAQAAIAKTLAALGAGSINAAIAAGATMEDFAGFGLGSGVDVCGGTPASLCTDANDDPMSGLAFPGINPLVGENVMLFPIGRSTYTALQTKLVSRFNSPVHMFNSASIQVAYSLSRFNTMAGDQDFINNAPDFANPTKFIGPSALDRRHQIAFGAFFRVGKGPQLSFIGHFNSGLAVTPTLVSGANAGEIFYTDLTGDGTNGDIVGNIGQFGRKYNGANINNLIDSFNSANAGKLTPAGQALVDAGLFTAAQLTALGATISPIPAAPSDQAGMGWLKTFDLRVAYPIKVHERFTILPSIAAFNIFNFTNYNISPAPGQILIGGLDGSPGSINGTPRFNVAQGNDGPPRAGLGTGVNTIGAPRQLEFGLRITF